MDLVRGRDLRAVWRQAGDRGELVPTPLAVYIVLEVLDGLQYAHELCDESGQHLAVVHRDVSPQNIMVSFDGDVKLIDFGLAASTMKLEKTQTNIVMGKLGYLAPEQVRGERADPRADVFATAVVLYELLTGQRFYGAHTPGLRSELIAGGRFEPALLGRLDEGLQGILRRALAGEREQRTPTAARFAAELRDWAAARALRSDAAALRECMRDLFGPTREPWEQASSPTALAASLTSRRPDPTPPVEATEIGRPSFLDDQVQTDEGSSTDERAIRTELQIRTRLVQPPSTSEATSLTTLRPVSSRPRRHAVVAGVVVGLALGVVAILGLVAVRDPREAAADAGLAAPVIAVSGAGTDTDTMQAIIVDAGVPGAAVDAGAAPGAVVDAAVDAVVVPGAGVAADAGVDAGVGVDGQADAGSVGVEAPRGERPRRGRRDRDVEAALARLDSAAAAGTPPVVQLKVIREVCGPSACEATMDGSLADRVAACLRSCRASVRRR